MSGNLDTSDILLNRGLNGGYGYAMGGHGNGHGNFPGDGSAVKESVRGNRDIALLESVNQGTRDQFLSSQIQQHAAASNDRINSTQDFLSSQISNQNSEFRFANLTTELASAERLAFANQSSTIALMTANKADTDRQLHAMDIKQTECCCELKAGQAAINAKLDSASTIGTANAEIANLRMQLQFNGGGNGNGNGHGNGGS